MEHKEVYYKIRDKAFSSALIILCNEHDAEDIAQNVCIKFLLSKKSIEHPRSWANIVAKNEAYALRKKQNCYNDNLADKVETIATQKKIETEVILEFEAISKAEAKDLLTKSDYDLYKLMLKHRQNANKIADSINKSKSFVYGACYRVKRNLKAAKLLKEDYRGSKEIVGYNLHQNILNFIKKLTTSMQNNNYKKMHNYFREINVSEIHKMDMIETMEYQIHLLGEKVYDIFIPFRDSQREIKFCIVDFKLNKLNEIVVTNITDNPATVLITENLSAKDHFKQKRKGLLVKTSEEAEQIFKNHFAIDITEST